MRSVLQRPDTLQDHLGSYATLEPMLKGRLIPSFAMVAFIACPMSANAQTESFIGPTVGLFFPSDSALRDALGNSWFSFGASRVKIDPYAKRNMGYDWNTFSKEQNGNKVFMVAGTIGTTMPMGKPGDMTRPYFAVRGGLSYIDYALNTTPANRISAKRIGFNANAEFGINVGQRLNLSARYDLFPSYDGLRFSGLSLAVKWGITKF